MCACAALVLLAACGKKAPPVVEKSVPVRVAAAESTTSEAPVLTSGRVVGERDALLSWKIGGRLASRAVSVGDRVARGAVLAVLDPVDARAAAAEADAALDYAERALLRAESLATSGAVPNARLGDARVAAQAARARRDQAHDALALTRLIAPFGAIVAGTWGEPGEVIAPGAPVVALLDHERLRVRASVGDRDAARVRIGDRASTPHGEGRVLAVAGAADPVSGLYRIDVSLPGGARGVGGEIVNVEVVPAGAARAARVPADAVVRRGGRDVVYVAVNGRADERAVDVGDPRASGVAIHSGVTPGDSVIVVGQHYVADGTAITIDR
jgi:RND family efflux transporter MFP subunit